MAACPRTLAIRRGVHEWVMAHNGGVSVSIHQRQPPAPENQSLLLTLSNFSGSGNAWSFHVRLPQRPKFELELTIPIFLDVVRNECKQYGRDVQRIEFSNNSVECTHAIRGFTSLVHLHVNHCSRVRSLLRDFDSFVHLEELRLVNCKSLASLPRGMEVLPKLTELWIDNCPKIEKLETTVCKLTSLQNLVLIRCKGLEQLPALHNLSLLTNLAIISCKELKEAPVLFPLTNLCRLNLEDCTSLLSFDGKWSLPLIWEAYYIAFLMSQHNRLGKNSRANCLNDEILRLILSVWISLQPWFPNSLNKLILSGCVKLTKLPMWIGEFTRLQKLELFKCSGLKELPASIEALTGLKKLDLRFCSELVRLPEIGALTRLTKLDLFQCSALKQLPASIGALTGLTEMQLRHCSSLTTLPLSFLELTNLEKLILIGCDNLDIPQDKRTLFKVRKHLQALA